MIVKLKDHLPEIRNLTILEQRAFRYGICESSDKTYTKDITQIQLTLFKEGISLFLA